MPSDNTKNLISAIGLIIMMIGASLALLGALGLFYGGIFLAVLGLVIYLVSLLKK